MSTPTENFDIAVDESSDDEARQLAIDQLQTANDCDALASLVRRDDLADRYREQALTSLAHPQCKPTLENLADGSDLPQSLQERARSLLSETPDDAGAGP